MSDRNGARRDEATPRAGGEQFSLAETGRIMRRGLHGQVLNVLGREIVDGVIPEGAVLNADALQERFEVSRSVIRETLRTLETMGMVSARPQRGTLVASRSNWDLLNQQVVLWRGQGQHYWDQMRDILELRAGVEVVAAGLAARRRLPEHVEALQQAIDRMDDAAARQDSAAFIEADIALHTLLFHGSGNAVIAQLANAVGAVLRTRLQDASHLFGHRTAGSIASHRALVEAVAAGDEAAAVSGARQIVVDTTDELELRHSHPIPL
ncbi:GntR family transcriptional regulator [Luteimicrobium album]|uniref:GntR family transcriptional regulator n=1 Tax=Luteimicrobium album TaxID=1054550 RepID=A0ABQ6I1S9_9MICO|nr:FCD domain-containing protein [Luteimicrobium album]GMA24427.1 GntR family transcriptional regulator [Luteimicrobium album]